MHEIAPTQILQKHGGSTNPEPKLLEFFRNRTAPRNTHFRFRHAVTQWKEASNVGLHS